MSNNLNQKFPKYVESDLSKHKIAKPPRNKNKELDIYVYETNQEITLVENTDGALAIQARLLKSIKFNPTTPLNFDISKPKFVSLSDTAIWGTQLNGFVYEDLNLDSSRYNFITLTVAQNDTIKVIAKYRIVSYNPISDNNNRFLYAELALVIDSAKTIKSIDKINWKIVNSFNNDTATKYIKIKIDKTSFISSDGLKLKGKRDPSFPNLVAGPYNLTAMSPNLTLMFVTLRKQSPFEFDISDLARFKRQAILGDAIINANPFDSNPFSSGVHARKITDSQTLMDIRYDDSYSLNPGQRTIPRKQYFDNGFVLIADERGISFHQKDLSINDVKSFLDGTYALEGELPPKFENPSYSSSPVKTEDLNPNTEADQKYFVLCKKMNLQKIFELKAVFPKPAIAQVFFKSVDSNHKPNAKTNLFRVEEWSDLIENEDNDGDFIRLELELLNPLFNPNIELLNLNNGIITITTYNASHGIIENELSFQPDIKGKTVIQL